MLSADRVRRVMVREQEGASIPFSLDAPQRRSQEIDLVMTDRSVGDDARVLQRIAVEGQNANERGFECEEYARLDLCGTRKAASFRHDREPVGRIAAKVAEIGIEALCMCER